MEEKLRKASLEESCSNKLNEIKTSNLSSSNQKPPPAETTSKKDKKKKNSKGSDDGSQLLRRPSMKKIKAFFDNNKNKEESSKEEKENTESHNGEERGVGDSDYVSAMSKLPKFEPDAVLPHESLVLQDSSSNNGSKVRV